MGRRKVFSNGGMSLKEREITLGLIVVHQWLKKVADVLFAADQLIDQP